jgi:alanyl-tRNA synthetase
MYSSTSTGGTGSGGAGSPDPASPPPETERVYHTDAYVRTFVARVTAVAPGQDPDRQTRIVLDRTAFYPSSGGQPHDTGTLAGAPVVDVIDADGRIVHVLAGPAAADGLSVGAEVQGTVDWDRRFDHMQLHTAQHVLSAAFLRVLGAETESVHLGDSATLDLDVSALVPEDARRVEEAANRVVFENRPVTVRQVDASAAASLNLRRPPRRTGPLRIVEVADFDRSACGGTHVRATGEIGHIVLRRWERRGGRIRVEFLCGWRALRDYWRKHALVTEWSARLGVHDQELGQAFHRLTAQGQERGRALEEARRRLAGYEAAERLAAAPLGPGRTVLRVEATHRDPDDVRMLLRELTTRARCIVLAGDGETGRLSFSRSAGQGPDMAALLGRVCAVEGGRGGGTAEFAQGAVPPGDAVARALARAEEEIARA